MQRLNEEAVSVVVLAPTAKFGNAVEPTGANDTLMVIAVAEPGTVFAVVTM